MDIAALVEGKVAIVVDLIRSHLVATRPPDSVVVVALADVLRRTTQAERFQTLLLTLFAGLALLLAAVGIAGIVGYTVARRTREIGIRLALGSTPSRVGSLIVRQSLFVVLVGALSGSICALAVTRALAGLLFQVKPTDPVTFAGAVVALLLVAALASLLPAVRAARIDPIAALRTE
jgi:putative ABC transport system permease protein